ncbi:hypothetical protein OC844_000235 [Tilletia horrida]|nr:hypothetical protein OC844_000235 [Tilletia horrida]
MRTTIALATIAAALVGSATAVPLDAITCTGQEIVGHLVVRNPDGSTHAAAFVQGDSDAQGRLKLSTKFNGVPSPKYAQFAAQICSSNEYIYGKRDKRQNGGQQTLTGFISPNNHRNKALTVTGSALSGSNSNSVFDVVSDTKASTTKFTNQAVNQWWTLYNNGSFYSLAYTGTEAGPTADPYFAPLTQRSADGQDIFVKIKSAGSGASDFPGWANYYGYSLELHPSS